MRSGTTLLMMIVDSSRTIAGPPHESYFMANFYGAQSQAKKETLPPPAGILPLLGRLAHGAYAEFCEAPGVREAVASAGSYAEAFDVVSTALAASVGKTRWADKTPGNEFFAQDILELFPGSRILYVLRDYRDVIASKTAKERASDDAPSSAWRESIRGAHLWRASVEAHLWNLTHLPRNRYTTLFYEDLVRQPRATLAGLADFMGEDLSETIEEKDGHIFYRPAARSLYPHRGRSNTSGERDSVQAYEISARSVGRGGQRLGWLETRLADRICGPYARVFGWGGSPARTSWRIFGERERRYARLLTRKAKFWYGQKGKRIDE